MIANIKNAKEITDDTIKEKQYQLNKFLSNVDLNNNLLTDEILQMSWDLDKLIVKYYEEQKSKNKKI